MLLQFHRSVEKGQKITTTENKLKKIDKLNTKI